MEIINQNRAVIVGTIVTVVTILVNVYLSLTGITQKLTCTVQQTANVATAILASEPDK